MLGRNDYLTRAAIHIVSPGAKALGVGDRPTRAEYAELKRARLEGLTFVEAAERIWETRRREKADA